MYQVSILKFSGLETKKGHYKWPFLYRKLQDRVITDEDYGPLPNMGHSWPAMVPCLVRARPPK